jgi:lambda family phage tail tape measure protein
MTMAAMRTNQAMSATSQQISGGLTTALTDVAMGTKTASGAFKDFSLIAIRAIEEMIIKLTIVQPLMQSLQSGISGSGILGLLGLGGGAASVSGSASGGVGISPATVMPASAMGNVFDQGHMINAYAMGDIVTRRTMFPMATGAGLIGEAGPEAIMPLKRGPDGRLGVAGGGNSSPSHMTISVSVDLSGANGDKTINDIAEAATARGVMLALKQVPSIAVNSVVNAANRGLRLHQ